MTTTNQGQPPPEYLIGNNSVSTGTKKTLSIGMETERYPKGWIVRDGDGEPAYLNEFQRGVINAYEAIIAKYEAASRAARERDVQNYENEIGQAVVVFESLYKLAAIGHGASAERDFQPLNCSDCALLESAQITLKRLADSSAPVKDEKCPKCQHDSGVGTHGVCITRDCFCRCDFSRPAAQRIVFEHGGEGPCSACGDGDTAMQFHAHAVVSEAARRTAERIDAELIQPYASGRRRYRTSDITHIIESELTKE